MPLACVALSPIGSSALSGEMTTNECPSGKPPSRIWTRHATEIADHVYSRRIAGDDSTPPPFAVAIPSSARFDAEVHPSKLQTILPCDASPSLQDHLGGRAGELNPRAVSQGDAAIRFNVFRLAIGGRDDPVLSG